VARRSLTERVEILEQTVEDLRGLPDHVAAVESQILQLRGEMRGEFSAIRERFEAVDRRFEAVDRRFDAINERFDETHRYMRVLHEDVVARLALLHEGRRERKKR